MHAAAIVKAYKKGDEELANSIYSGVPSHHFGLEQIIEIGPLSGRSNVILLARKTRRRGRPTSGGPNL